MLNEYVKKNTTATTFVTRMVQLPATAAIEYMSPLGTRTRTRTKTKTVRGGGLMPVPPKFNAYTHRLGFLCLAS